MSETWQGFLQKIDNCRFRIPKSYKSGMRVDGIIYADEKLLRDVREDKACEQVANVAFLPGIVNYSLAMPDIHWGYGFCIGGVAATDPDNGGVVSPAGVGYDINCLTGDAKVLYDLGYTVPIEDSESKWRGELLTCMDFSSQRKEHTPVARYLKMRSKEEVFELETFCGNKIKATADHPFWTQDGMAPLKRLKEGEKVALFPFEGVPYGEPQDLVLVSEEDIEVLLRKLRPGGGGNGIQQIIAQLKKRNLLPLHLTSKALPYLIKVLGYCWGDGSIYFTNKCGKGVTWFWGKSRDLEFIRKDIEEIGFTCSRVYRRRRAHKIQTRYDLFEFSNLEESCKVVSSAFALLLVALGCPFGNKSEKAFSVPKWLFKAPLWQKRLFLASFFGAEMSSPKTFAEHSFNLYCPVLSQNKSEMLVGDGKKFLRDISLLLSQFGVRTHKISENPEYISKSGIVKYRLRLILSGRSDDLINLYGRVGFEYNQERSFLANVVVHFLRYKKKVLSFRQHAQEQAVMLHSQGQGIDDIYNQLGSNFINRRFIERSVYEGRKTDPRVSSNALNFVEFLEAHTDGLGYSGMVWDEVVAIRRIDSPGQVYDFTVTHKDHNFVANNFVVSNCGVRLVRTNLRFDDIKDKIKDLTYALFSNIPSGLGSKGDIRVSAREEKELLEKGAKWAVEQGFGIADDLECTEENGAISGADPDAVSDRAYERGKAQSGTLGSGNHFIEVQVIEKIFAPEIAAQFNLEEGQICVMIHSGSRGLGYQVCDDYVKGMIKCLDKYDIAVPDRQLACAPINSPEAKSYLGAMRCAANYAWANRQCLMHLTREVFEKFFKSSWQAMEMFLIYDVAHNIAKFEKHIVDGKEKLLCVHRKGATRAFPPGHPDLPQRYQQTGQPVIIPGDMGRNSYLLVGTEQAAETFYSTCHGAGRVKSRTAATKAFNVGELLKDLESKGITVKASSRGTLAEEAPLAYKDVNDVVEVVHNAGISKRVCRMRPLGVIKG